MDNHVEFKNYSKIPKGAKKIFRLMPQEFSAVVNFPLVSLIKGVKVKLGKVKLTQLPVNYNIVTTGHKLQGMSKDSLVVNSCECNFKNWVYIVLSRVRTKAGLMLNCKLDLHKCFKVPEKLLGFEIRMKEGEEKYLKTVHGIKSWEGSIAKV